MNSIISGIANHIEKTLDLISLVPSSSLPEIKQRGYVASKSTATTAAQDLSNLFQGCSCFVK